jgi:hypothetical protein
MLYRPGADNAAPIAGHFLTQTTRRADEVAIVAAGSSSASVPSRIGFS